MTRPTPKRHLITSALPYINGMKHLGNLIGSILPADVYARFLRQRGDDVLYICGTDEHGTPAEIAAQQAGQSVEAYCETFYGVQKEVYEAFGISFDWFGRSSSPSNHHLTQEIFRALKDKGLIQEQVIQQYYSPKDQRFLADRYVEGTCPKCDSPKARGDQCDGCGTLLTPTELREPYSAISQSKDLELRQSRHFFLALQDMTDRLSQWIQEHDHWSDTVKGIAGKWLNEGLKARCITRDLKWGIPVHQPGFEDKVFYVWFDAPNAYISITQDWANAQGDQDAWKTWWKPGNGAPVSYTQFMAKDNVPFHAIFWPAVVLASQLGFRTVDTLKGFHWLTYDGGKFSTSQKRGVFADQALELFPADYWRYYLLFQAPETSDSDFTFTHFAAVVNKDLADVLGNFVNRTFALVHKYGKGQIQASLLSHNLNSHVLTQATERVKKLAEHLSRLQFRQATQTLRSLWVLGNEYIASTKPWDVIKDDPQEGHRILSHCLHLIRLFGIVSHPFIPQTARQLVRLLGDDALLGGLETTPFEEGLNFQALPQGQELSQPEVLFQKIEPSTVEALTQRFAGDSHEKR